MRGQKMDERRDAQEHLPLSRHRRTRVRSLRRVQPACLGQRGRLQRLQLALRQNKHGHSHVGRVAID